MWKSPEFWIAVAIAILVKMRTSSKLSFLQTVYTIVVALGAAYIATEWVSFRTGIPEPITAGLIALTAEGLMRKALCVVENPKEAIDLLKMWRGK